ncbi:hypothetical protein DIPPA_29588 [Diplonema papillatum]|nr:hypothetical protein DIPPA_29588 [Diplonema papillatum]
MPVLHVFVAEGALEGLPGGEFAYVYLGGGRAGVVGEALKRVGDLGEAPTPEVVERLVGSVDVAWGKAGVGAGELLASVPEDGGWWDRALGSGDSVFIRKKLVVQRRSQSPIPSPTLAGTQNHPFQTPGWPAVSSLVDAVLPSFAASPGLPDKQPIPHTPSSHAFDWRQFNQPAVASTPRRPPPCTTPRSNANPNTSLDDPIWCGRADPIAAGAAFPAAGGGGSGGGDKMDEMLELLKPAMRRMVRDIVARAESRSQPRGRGRSPSPAPPPPELSAADNLSPARYNSWDQLATPDLITGAGAPPPHAVPDEPPANPPAPPEAPGTNSRPHVRTPRRSLPPGPRKAETPSHEDLVREFYKAQSAGKPGQADEGEPAVTGEDLRRIRQARRDIRKIRAAPAMLSGGGGPQASERLRLYRRRAGKSGAAASPLERACDELQAAEAGGDRERSDSAYRDLLAILRGESTDEDASGGGSAERLLRQQAAARRNVHRDESWDWVTILQASPRHPHRRKFPRPMDEQLERKLSSKHNPYR